MLQKYHWPGNIRELENLIKRYVILGHEEAITYGLGWRNPDFLNADISFDGPISLKKLAHQAVRELERKVIPKCCNSITGTANRRRARSESAIARCSTKFATPDCRRTGHCVCARPRTRLPQTKAEPQPTNADRIKPNSTAETLRAKRISSWSSRRSLRLGGGVSRPERAIQRPVLNRLRDVLGLQFGLCFQIGDGARDLQNTVVALRPCCVMARSSRCSQSAESTQNLRMCCGDICALQ